MQSAKAAQQGMPIPMGASMVLQDYQNGQTHRKMLDNVAKTLEQLFDYYMAEQQPSFKSQMKALVRRVITTGVGYVKVDSSVIWTEAQRYQSKLADIQAQLDYIRRIASEAADGDIREDDPQIEELMLSMKALMDQPMITIREGLVFDFPESNSIIVDPMCRQLRGFVGASWIAHKMFLTVEEVKEIYNVDLNSQYRQYDMKGNITGETYGTNRTTIESYQGDHWRRSCPSL